MATELIIWEAIADLNDRISTKTYERNSNCSGFKSEGVGDSGLFLYEGMVRGTKGTQKV